MLLKKYYDDYKRNIEKINNSSLSDKAKKYALVENYWDFCDSYNSIKNAYVEGFAEGFAETQVKLYNKSWDEAYERGIKLSDMSWKKSLARKLKAEGSSMEDIVDLTKLPEEVINLL